jgi:lipopolysaccharide/colanic/teichoic acid biosynthesis glycosyltransferase
MLPHGKVFKATGVDEGVACEDGGAGHPPLLSSTALSAPYDPRTDPLGTLFSLSRRHELPFGVLVVRIRATSNGSARPSTDFSVRLWQLIESETRETDAVTAWGPDRTVIGCPATSPDGTRLLAKRLCASAGDLPIGVGAASFREDGLTLADLIACASSRANAQHPEEGPPPPPHGPNPRHRRTANGLLGSRLSEMVKRLFDLTLIVATAPVWLPLVLLTAAAVKISDPSAPVLFAHDRTGRGGRRFRMLKFRTMVPDAEARKTELADQNQRSWPDFKIDFDPRITPLGRHLRASSLDELPQIWNVIRGDMSLVGPRPTSFSADTYQAWQTARLEATPGLTGLWQVSARNGTDFAERIRIDLRYVRNRGFFYDLRILLRTVPAVLWHREGR